MLMASATPTVVGLLAQRPPSTSRWRSNSNAGKYVGAAEVAMATSAIRTRQSRRRRGWCGVLNRYTVSLVML